MILYSLMDYVFLTYSWIVLQHSTELSGLVSVTEQEIVIPVLLMSAGVSVQLVDASARLHRFVNWALLVVRGAA